MKLAFISARDAILARGQDLREKTISDRGPTTGGGPRLVKREYWSRTFEGRER